MPDLQSTYRKHPDFVPRVIAGEHLLVPMRRVAGQPDALYVLNETGGFIWDRVAATVPMAAIRDELATQFAVTPEQATRDVLDLVQQLTAIGALEPLTPTAA